MLISRLSRRILTAVMFAAVSALISQQAHASCAPSDKRADIRQAVADAARANGTVPRALALAVARVESNFDANALSRAGARGVMQIMPETGRGEFGLEPDELWDPATNIDTGLSYLSHLYEYYGRDWNLALSHYNAGSLKKLNGSYVTHPVTRGYLEKVDHFRRVYENSDQYPRDGERLERKRSSRFSVNGLSRTQSASCPAESADLQNEIETEVQQWVDPTVVRQSPTQSRFLLDDSEPGARRKRFGWTGDQEIPLNGEDRFR